MTRPVPEFATLKKLSERFVDFLMLLAVEMDANRNYEHYVERNNPKLDDALGNDEWRKRWMSAGRPRAHFPNFLVAEVAKSMSSLNYLERRHGDMKLIKLQENNRGLYYLALFSRNATAHKFWNQVLKYATDQTTFWD